ncbi:MAG: hypothetical protein JW882_03705 [Deltaproteobacteria bacterium]|nr:hypothetical protein [Deltaproteobacteria bacterium]
MQERSIEASAPCRIDSGGTWDIKAIAIPFERIQPVTVNMALDLRTGVLISPFDDGWIKISSEGFPGEEISHFERLSFNSVFAIFFAAAAYFGFHGLEIRIRSDSPVKSALGGSSTGIVALLKALSGLCEAIGMKGLSRKEILHLGYHIEDGITGGNCGLQDQAAAVYGGVNRWLWRYGRGDKNPGRERLIDRNGEKELSERIVVAFSGKSHFSAEINRAWIRSFLKGETRHGWIKVNEIVSRFGDSIRERDWEKASSLLKAEMSIRRQITPDVLIPETSMLIDQAEGSGCAARFAGAGAGGSVWAFGDPDKIRRLKYIWAESLKNIKDGMVLECSVDHSGVM